MSVSTSDQLKALQAQMDALKATIPQSKIGELTVKIGDKGTVNIYGLGRFPVCLYAGQVNKIQALFNSPAFSEFLAANVDKLSFK